MGDRSLLRCPMCGGYPKIRRKNRTVIGGVEKRNTYIYCPICDVRGTRILYEDYATYEEAENKAKEMWNRRY